MAHTPLLSSEKLFEKYGRNRTTKPEQANSEEHYQPVFPPYTIYPIAVNDILREIKKRNSLPTNAEELKTYLEEHPKAFSFKELLEILDANEIDTLSHERKYEELYPDWILKKRLVERAKEYYYNPQNTNKILHISILPDESLKIGKEPKCEYVTFDYERLLLDIMDIDRFSIQLSFLQQIRRTVTQMSENDLIDGQYDRPNVVRFLIDQRDFWEIFETTEDLPEQIGAEMKSNAVLFSHLYEQSLEYPTKEDKELEEESKTQN